MRNCSLGISLSNDPFYWTPISKYFCKHKGEEFRNLVSVKWTNRFADFLSYLFGVTFSNNYSFSQHIDNRVRKYRQSYCSLPNSGLSYPGATTDVKRYMWNSICVPVLTYGMESITINKKDMQQLETLQGNLVKQCLGLSKICHSGN